MYKILVDKSQDVGCETKVHRLLLKVKGKGKIEPRTGHEGPEEEQRYSSTLSLTSALHRGGWLTPRPGHLTRGRDTVRIVQEARSLESAFDPRTAQPLESRYTD